MYFKLNSPLLGSKSTQLYHMSGTLCFCLKVTQHMTLLFISNPNSKTPWSMLSVGALCVWNLELSRPWSSLFTSLNTIKKSDGHGRCRFLLTAGTRQSHGSSCSNSLSLIFESKIFTLELCHYLKTPVEAPHVRLRKMLSKILISVTSLITHFCLLWGGFKRETTRSICSCFWSKRRILMLYVCGLFFV